MADVISPRARKRRGWIGSLVVAAALLSLTGCGASKPDGSTSDTITGSITVDAAASLQGAFTEMKDAFISSYPGVAVTLNFAASSMLVQQLTAGAPADVFASADQSTMKKVVDADLVDGAPSIFAINSLQIIVRKGNPPKVTALSDLSRPGLVVVSCAPSVPIGRYTADALTKAGVTVRFASLEPDVKGIVTKVTSGEADAGVVYATDVQATKGAATGVPIAKDLDVVATYPIASLKASKNPATASAWVQFVLSPQGQQILQSHGFGTP